MQSALHHAILSSNHQPVEPVQLDNQQAANMQKVNKNLFWVGPGNNSAVVKNVLKQRYWW